jgi:thiosulfate/3-mercaptopyruvate sulfurtransferase
MPGATSVPFTELVEDGHLKPAAQLHNFFAQKHINLQQPITTTCGSGVTAAVIALSLAILGAANVNLYDGSWSEYAQHPDSVIEKSS